jgi:hypothetical protein
LRISIFAAAIALSVAGITSLAISLGLCVVAYLLLGIISGRDFYALIEWKVIVLLACLIPVAGALEETGGSELIAGPHCQSDRKPAGMGRADGADGHHHDAVGLSQQCGDRADCRADRGERRQLHRRQPGPVPDGRRGGRLLRLPHPDRPQEQHHHHGPRQLPASATTGAWD